MWMSNLSNLFSNPRKPLPTPAEPPFHFLQHLPIEPVPAPPLAPSKPTLKVQIRWLIQNDMPAVLDIEHRSFEFEWCEKDFLCCLGRRVPACIGMVAEYNHRIIGFMVYELHKAKLHVLKFAVDPEFRRQKVGAQMVEKLVDKLSQQRRNEIVIEVRETNLGAQLFFKKMKFRAVKVLHNHYDDTTEDAFVMRYYLYGEGSIFFPLTPTGAVAQGNPFAFVNRISEYYADVDAA